MTTFPYETQRPIVSDNILAVVVYLLYCVGYFTGISALIGVIIAYVKLDDTDPVLRSHYRFQIRTFWIGLLYLAIGIPLCLALVGIPILAWWFIWSLPGRIRHRADAAHCQEAWPQLAAGSL